MKILYVSQYFPPEMGAPAARAAELSRYWAENGHEVTVLTGFPNHPTGVVPLQYRRKFRQLVMRENVDGANVVRTWLLPFPNRKAYERMLNYGSFFVSSASTGLFLSRPDVVIATSPQLLVALTGWWLARCKSVPFVFEVRDLWPESLAAVGMGDKDSLLHRSLAKVAGFLYRNSERVAVVTPAFKDYLVERWHVPPGKIAIVQNGVDTDLFSPQETNGDLTRELATEGKFVVSYIGTLGLAHALDTLLEAAARLRDSHPEVLFLLVGEGSDKERLVSLARSQRLSNLRFVDQQPREKIPAYICASHACLVLLKKADVFKTVIPTKMLEFMACARPVILGVDGQARKIIEDAQAGLFVEPEKADELARAITLLAGNPSLCESFGRNGRRHILSGYSRRQTADVYIEVLEEFVGNNRRRRKLAA